jgi:hypothetical protein
MTNLLSVASAPNVIKLDSVEGKKYKGDRLLLQRRYVIARTDAVSLKLRALSQSVDEVTGMFGLRVYRDMLADPDVSAAYWNLVYSILAEELQVNSCIKKETDPDYGTARMVAEFCKANLDGLATPFRDTLEQMLEAIAFAHKIGEVTYKLDTYEGEQRLMLDGITVLPHTATAFVVDEFMRVIGLVARRTTTGYASISTIVNERDIIPRDKFFILTMRAKDGDPRGTSLLRPAWNGYNFKKQVWPEYLLWLINCAVPSLFGFTAPDERDTVKKDETGAVQYDSQNNPIYLTPEEAMAERLAQVRNAYVGAFPHGSDVKWIDSKGTGEPFEKAIGVGGEEITKAILLQTLATREGKHQTRASTATQMSLVDILVWAIKGILCQQIKQDIFRPLLRYNFGEMVARRFMPHTSLGDYERRNWATDSTGASALIPYCYPSQAEWIKEQLGVPVKEDGEEEYVGNLGGSGQTGTTGLPGQLPPPVPGQGRGVPQPGATA